MLRLLTQRPRARHPNPAQAVDALREGRCLYSPVSGCSARLLQAGLRHRDDPNVVLCCSAHVGRLRRLPDRDLDKLEATLLHAFNATTRDDD